MKAGFFAAKKKKEKILLLCYITYTQCSSKRDKNKDAAIKIVKDKFLSLSITNRIHKGFWLVSFKTSSQ